MGLDRIYNLLRRENSPIIDRAIAEALPTADGAAAAYMVPILLERGTDRGRLGLVKAFDALPGSRKADVVAGAGDFEHALRKAGRNGNEQTCLNLIDIVQRSGMARYAFLLVSQLHATEPTVVRAAARGLLSLATQVMDHPDSRPNPDEMDRSQRAQLMVGAVCDACTFFHRHRRRDVLLAATALATTRDPRLLELLGNRHVPSHGAMVELIRQAEHPLICRALLILSTQKALAATVADALGRSHTSKNTLEVLGQASLVQLPAVRAMLKRVTRPERLLPTYKRLKQLTPAQLRAMPGWITALDADEGLAAESLGHVATLGDPPTRLLALRGLRKLDHQAAYRLISALCFDANPRIARRALRHLVQRKWDGLIGLMVRLVGSNHPRVQTLAEEQFAPVAFDRIWHGWDHLSDHTRLAAGRALIKIDGRFHHRLADRLHGEQVRHRLKALTIMRKLGQATYFEQSLLALAQDRDARVASSAVISLGGIDQSAHAVTMLIKSLHHTDDRVRSNAIEALEGMGQLESVRRQLFAIAGSRGNRSRATAIKSLMVMSKDKATDALADMLEDRDTRHRVSALWVVEQTGEVNVVKRVAEVAKQDPEPHVRRRAVNVIRKLAAAHEQTQLAKAG